MKFLKNNTIGIISILSIIGLFIYLEYYKKPEVKTLNIDNITKLDSIQSKMREEYRLKLDSMNTIFNTRINKLQQKDKQLENKIKNLDNTVGELPDFN